jgi:hypothetical protein
MSSNKKWHPQPANLGGNGGPYNDFKDWWDFPCCNKRVFSDVEPSQEREDGCQVKN